MFQRNKTNPKSTTHLDLESLEARAVPATIATSPVSIDVGVDDNAILQIDGSNYRDNVSVSVTGNYLYVFTSQPDLGIAYNRAYYFNAASVNRIHFSGRGSDDVFVNYSNETTLAFGGDGNDYLYTNGLNSALYGDNHSDTLVAGVYGNVALVGGNHNDYMYGNDYANAMYGGSGNDTMYGNGGNDSMNGNDGYDYIRGGIGNDFIRGGNQRDALYGDSGYDTLLGEGDRDVLVGGDHNDVLYGGDSTDYLYGGNGNDSLYGEAGRDYLFGQAHNDYLNGGRDGYFDYLSGGSGADRFEFHRSWWWFDVGETDNHADYNYYEGDRVV